MNANFVWSNQIKKLLDVETVVSPRGQATQELRHQTMIFPLDSCIITVPERKLNYRFMLAEAAWILRGRSDVDYLAQYNPNMMQFSDDGCTLAGAYGPPIHRQMQYVTDKLNADPDSRQAALTIWRPNPSPSKDIPCTIAMIFMVRRNLLNVHVFMRSSDIWLGVPYDIFSFSMVGLHVMNHLKWNVRPGSLYLTMASSHLYDRNKDAASQLILSGSGARTAAAKPFTPLMGTDSLAEILEAAIADKGLRWWL